MSVDQINQKIFSLGTGFCLLLSSCDSLESLKSVQSNWLNSPQPSMSSKQLMSDQELAFEPPISLKTLNNPLEENELKPIANINSVDRAGHRRLQIYLLQNKPPTQSQYWQLIERHRSQYDVIWIYTTNSPNLESSQWLAHAAWFQSKLPRSFHYLDFNPKHQHDGLYWTDAN